MTKKYLPIDPSQQAMTSSAAQKTEVIYAMLRDLCQMRVPVTIKGANMYDTIYFFHEPAETREVFLENLPDGALFWLVLDGKKTKPVKADFVDTLVISHAVENPVVFSRNPFSVYIPDIKTKAMRATGDPVAFEETLTLFMCGVKADNMKEVKTEKE